MEGLGVFGIVGLFLVVVPNVGIVDDGVVIGVYY